MGGVRVTRNQAFAALTGAVVMVTAGLVWLIGAWGLIVMGLLVAAVVVLGVDIEEGPGRETVADAASPPWRGGPVHRQ